MATNGAMPPPSFTGRAEPTKAACTLLPTRLISPAAVVSLVPITSTAITITATIANTVATTAATIAAPVTTPSLGSPHAAPAADARCTPERLALDTRDL